MLSEFYLNFLKTHLTESQLLTLEMLVWLLQRHKQVKIERLYECLPLTILYKSRRRHVQREISLFDYYKPFTPVPPYRVSVPTRGVFMEAIQGECDACELVKENSSQDWDKFRTEEPTPISPIITPTPTISDYKPQYKDFAPPLVNIQNAPNAPAPAAGLSQLTELLGKAGVFNDITGLEGNQQNVIDTYLSNQANAKAFAEMAKNLLMQQHNTQNSKDFIKRIEQARDNGAISEDDYKELTKQHLQQQIDGGESAKENAQLERERSKPSLTDAAIDAIDEGQSVQAERTVDGNRESITVQQKDGDSSHFVNLRYQIEPIKQPLPMSCWATAATIMMNWKNSTSSSIEEVLQEAGRNRIPSDEDYYLQIYNEDLGLEAHEKEQFTSSLGMISEPPANYILSQYVEWLQDYGPLWITTDDDSGSGFSPHARILFGIQGDIENNPNNVLFTFIDPADSTEVSETFNDFIKYYEQMVTDIPSNSSLFIQIVRFEDRAILSEGKATQRIRVHNEFLDNDKQIGNFVVNISSENETFSRDFSFSGNGYHNIDISDFEDGLYLMSVTPENTLEPPINWPSLGASISGTKPPDRIWQKIETEIEPTFGSPTDEVHLKSFKKRDLILKKKVNLINGI